MIQLTVAIPARDEAATIEQTLASIVAQKLAPPGSFDVIVLANNCNDDTAGIARAVARDHSAIPIDVVEMTFPASDAHIGLARRTVMDEAVARFARRSLDGIVATTDADTLVDEHWIANTLVAMDGADAVAGKIGIRADQMHQMPAPQRDAFEAQRTYAHTVALLEATLDPTPWDPPPRHADHFGASFAVRRSAYEHVGGVPALDRLEDLALYLALLRADFRVRHACNVKVATSARSSARVTGGFATYLDEVTLDRNRHVEDPRTTIANVRARAALRRFHARPTNRHEMQAAQAALEIPMTLLREEFDAAAHFGENWQRIETLALPYRTTYPRVNALAATDALRRAAGERQLIPDLLDE